MNYVAEEFWVNDRVDGIGDFDGYANETEKIPTLGGDVRDVFVDI